jgi:hypothetical protein
MPNHVTNILKAPAYVLAALEGKKSKVDFSALIPMAPSLEGVTCNGDENLVKFLFGALPINPGKDDPLGRLTLRNAIDIIQRGGLKDFDGVRFENFVTMLRNYRKYGTPDWYSFACENWGTKWNAYSIEEQEDGIKFETAWSAPHPVIETLVAKFPEALIQHLWADEDIGHNLGYRIYQNGKVTEPTIKDPVDFALTLQEDRREYYRKNPETGKWEYNEIAEEG